MDRLRRLFTLNLNQLLELADKMSIPVQSRISKCIVHSDIIPEILKTNPVDVIFEITFGDEWGRSLALEVGVNPDLFPDSTPNDERKVFITKTREWLQIQGIFQQYLGDYTLLSVVAAVIYERKLETPGIFWYPGKSTSLIFCSSLNDFLDSHDTYADDTPETYIWENQIYYDRKKCFPVLFYQKVEHLLALAQSLPSKERYFQTRIGLIDYLQRRWKANPDLGDYYLGFLSEFHQNVYPDRLDLIQRVYQLPKRVQIIPSYIQDISESELLAMPPVYYEEQYFRILITHKICVINLG